MTPQQDAKPYALATTWRYNTTRLLGEANFRYVGGGYITDIGYVPRLYLRDTSGLRIPNGFAWGSGYAAYRFFAKPASPIDYFEPRFITNWYGDTSFNYNEHRITTRFTLRFKRSNYIELELIDESPRVYFPLQFAGTQAYLPVGNYRTQRFNLEYDTGKRKRFYGNLSVGYGGFYNGHRLLLRGEVNYRVQPWGVFGATFTQANLYFPDESSLLTLIGPRFELAFTRNIFLTTFLQYNTQRQNFNINTRFWWRYAPMSDIYLVYTENYGTEYLNIKNRALVLKLNYWLQ